jgi:hypothetical protein
MNLSFPVLRLSQADVTAPISGRFRHYFKLDTGVAATVSGCGQRAGEAFCISVLGPDQFLRSLVMKTQM